MKIILLLLAHSVAFAVPVQYRLSFPNAVHHEAEIEVTFSGVSQPLLEVIMSRSSPGRYALHEFAKNVYHFTATDGEGNPLPVDRPNPYGWNISGHHGTVVVRYTLFGDYVDGTYVGIDETHAHLNLPATLVWAHGFEHAAASLSFDVPKGSGWRAATQLVSQEDGTWSAPNLEWLMDSPVELSANTFADWKSAGQNFRLAVHHAGTSEAFKSFVKMCQSVVWEGEGVFGEFPKFDDGRYTFLLDYLPYAFGDGMEHRNSTSISGDLDLSDGANQAIGTVSHEFFHAWNVKRIRPRSLEPFDFERANMSGELWFAEGFTSYYGPLMIQRAGLSTLDAFVQDIGGSVNRVLNAPGREVFSAVEMSRLAPFVDAARSVDKTNYRNTFISYYTYGAALAFGIDLSIRDQFPGKSLDDWMRVMWRRHSEIDRPYGLRDLEAGLAEATGSREFARSIFERRIEGKEPFDYASLAAAAGLQIRKANAGKPWIGSDSFEETNHTVKLNETSLRGSPLYVAGLEAGDEILRCNGKGVDSANDLRHCFEKKKPGDKLALEYRTRAGTRSAVVVVAEDPKIEVVTFEKAGLAITEPVKFFRQSWLGSKARKHESDAVVVIW